MKFDPFQWHEVKANEEVQVAKGWLRLRCSAEVAAYLSAEGHEALLGLGASFDAEVSEEMTLRVDAPEGARVFLHRPRGSAFEPDQEVYTNIDRMPSESGNLAEVNRAVRLFEMQRRAALREIRAERDALVAARAAQVVEPEAKPVVDLAVQPAGEPEASS